MKFNKLIFMLTIFFVAAMVVGCSSGANSSQPENNAGVSEGQKVAFPEEQPDLIGKVKNIVDNEVTVYKAEAGQNEGPPEEEPPSEEVQDKIKAIREKVDNGTITPEQADEEMKNLGFQPGQMQNRPNGIKFTEETQTFTIPEGTPIATMQKGADEANQVELIEIKKDTVLRIWKNDDTVSFIEIMGDSGAMDARQGGPGAGGGPPPDMDGGQ